MLTSFGADFGQSVAKIRVLDCETGAKILPHFALLRYVLKYTLGLISFFTVHSNDDLRAIHDYAGKSVVVDVS